MPSGGGNIAAAFRANPPGKGRHYRDYDFVPTRSGPLDYNECDPEAPQTHPKRKRNADVDQSRQHPFKKSRKSRDNRSDRLCLQCGNYHSSPCYVPYCSSCDLNHYPGVPCLDAMEQLKERLEFHAPSEKALSLKQGNKKNMMAPASLPLRFHDDNHALPVSPHLQAPRSLLKSASQSPVNKQQKGSPNKQSCPICRQCGCFHRLACKWAICEQCHNKHHPETPCAVAETRLKRRLEEEDARKAQAMEQIMKQEKIEINMTDEMLPAISQPMRSTLPSPGQTRTPESATRKLKKNTRFCRDCGRYLNKPCTWPTCGKCNTKHFEHIPCWQARQNLQNRLDTFDCGYGTSQKKKPAKVKALPSTAESSSQQIEHATREDTADATLPMDVGTLPDSTVGSDENGEMSWSLDLNKNSPPTNTHLSISTTPKSPEHHGHVHPSRQSFFSKLSKTAAYIPDSLTSIISSASTPPSDSLRNEAPNLITYGASVEENVDAFIADVFRDMHGNDNIADAPEHADVPQGLPSYLDYLRRNGI